jgi:hypothetical protein
MKLPSLFRLVLLAGAFGVASAPATFAQDTNAPSSDNPSWHHHFDSVLTADEKAELKSDREQVFAANPDLKSEGDALWQQRKTMKDASPEDKKAFFEKMHAYMDKVDAAIVKLDPNAAPIIAKLKASFHHHDDSGSSSSSDSSSSN